MASQKLFIVDSQDEISDGIIQSREKEVIGRAWQNEAPVGHFISCTLENHWIINEEDYKLLKEAKKK